MNCKLVTIASAVLLLLSVTSIRVNGDPVEKCDPTSKNGSYFIADDKQCDAYHECTTSGKVYQRLCDDGFVYSEAISACNYPYNVDCSSRPNLQPPRSEHPNCPRRNGLYPFPAKESCQKFYHCLEGRAYEKQCPEAVIFDPALGSCVHPDLSKRADCKASEVLHFKCPNEGKRFSKLKFGDHDRLANPEDCRKFFICLQDGQPRVGTCPIGKVFNPKSGVCDRAKNVAGCENYYGGKSLEELEQEEDKREKAEKGQIEDA